MWTKQLYLAPPRSPSSLPLHSPSLPRTHTEVKLPSRFPLPPPPVLPAMSASRRVLSSLGARNRAPKEPCVPVLCPEHAGFISLRMRIAVIICVFLLAWPQNQQGLKGAFARTQTANALPALAPLLGIAPCSIVESMDPGWMVRLLKPIKVQRDGVEHTLETTQVCLCVCVWSLGLCVLVHLTFFIRGEGEGEDRDICPQDIQFVTESPNGKGTSSGNKHPVVLAAATGWLREWAHKARSPAVHSPLPRQHTHSRAPFTPHPNFAGCDRVLRERPAYPCLVGD